jgi:aspartyl protease family protein
MRNILVFAAILTGLGVYMAHLADSIQPTKIAVAANQGRAPVMSDAPAAAGRRSHTIGRDSRGHFSTDGRVEGRRIGFMVDTGASVVALTESSAAQVGIRPSRSDFTAPVSTANGVVKAARARLASVDIGGLEVRDVDAMVLPDNVLSENLLGLSYLSRLKRFEYSGGKLVLEQ